MIELVLDSNFRITGQAFIHEYKDPKVLYDQWLHAKSQLPIDDDMNLQFLSRLAGADNRDAMKEHPQKVRDQLRRLLEPHGLYSDEAKSHVESVVQDIEHAVTNTMQDIEELEKTRRVLGTDRGRAGNVKEDDNPIHSLWLLIKDNYKGMTADQFFGLDPIDKQGYDVWPLYLGVVGLHTQLNFLGFSADRGLANVNKLPGILSDGAHTAMATYCNAIISEDKKFCAKARAIYKYLEINTQVLEVNLNNSKA